MTAHGGAGALALLVDINALAQLVSIGTLFVFYMVDAGVLVRRFYEPGSGNWRALAARFAAMLGFNLGALPCPPPPAPARPPARLPVTHCTRHDGRCQILDSGNVLKRPESWAQDSRWLSGCTPQSPCT